MGATTTLSRHPLLVEPGGEVLLDVEVRNTGTVVDAFTVTPIGAAAGWTAVEPPSVSLLPGTTGTVSVRFRPPRDPATPVGSVPFGLRIDAAEDPTGTVVEEGVLDVASFTATSAELHPVTSQARGRRRGAHRVAVDNRGNVPQTVQLSAVDADDLLDVALTPPVLLIAPGGVAWAEIRPRAEKRFWRGDPVLHPFQILVEAEQDGPIVLDARLEQRAVLPAWLVKALLLVALGIAALVALWFAVLKPSIQDLAGSAATKAAQQSGAAAGSAAGADAAKKALGSPKQAPGSPKQAPGGAPSKPATTKPTPTAAAGPSPAPKAVGPSYLDPYGNPDSVRLVAGGKASRTFTTAEIFSLTDLFFENPNEDKGSVVVRRDGAPLFTKSLRSFLDLDEHFAAPIVFAPGSTLSFDVQCANPPTSKGTEAPCSAAVFATGFTRAPSPSPSPAP